MSGSHQYTYHNEKTGEYFGKYLPEQNDIVYRAKEKMVNHHHARLHARLKAQSILHTNSNNSAVGEYVENKDNSTGTGTGTEAGAVEVVAVVVDAPICAGGVCGPSGVETLNTSRLPVVFVFTVVPTLCVRGLPSYIKTALQQAMFTQPDCDVLLVSNFKDCASVRESVKELTTLKLVDSSLMASNRTVWYNRICSNMFRSDGVGELWMTSALRFFIIEDLMRESGTMKSGTTKSGYRELLHIEADNMLYGKLSSLLPVLRSGYPGLAATPLTAKTNMITASVFWVSAPASLSAFNDYLLSLGTDQGQGGAWEGFLTWLRPHGCCRPGGTRSVSPCLCVSASLCLYILYFALTPTHPPSFSFSSLPPLAVPTCLRPAARQGRER
ncbi:hypothetical protein B484DRAFT_73404 [Ochromonadaceae sp. CCMP2298]|nr:hypothetical protein B484DRAFT_73404 [Ochromonadaceae sp. CCMP2298]